MWSGFTVRYFEPILPARMKKQKMLMIPHLPSLIYNVFLCPFFLVLYTAREITSGKLSMNEKMGFKRKL